MQFKLDVSYCKIHGSFCLIYLGVCAPDHGWTQANDPNNNTYNQGSAFA